jgi:hypothetical protein
VETNQHGHLVLECMQLLDMEAGDHVSVDDLAEYAFGQGVGLDELESAICHASSNGWIYRTDNQIYLTARGYKLLNPANDHSAELTPALCASRDADEFGQQVRPFRVVGPRF